MGAVVADESQHATPPPDTARTVLFPFLNGFCYAIKRGVIERVGLLDEERFAEGYCEENDYSHARARRGLRAGRGGRRVRAPRQVRAPTARRAAASGRGRTTRAFLEKHGREEVQALVAELEDDRELAAGARGRGRADRQPAGRRVAARAAASGEPLSVAFLLPGLAHGGSGGSHSLYQETRALRSLGVPARIMLPRWDMERAAAVYEDAGEIFETFADEEDLAEQDRRRRCDLRDPPQVGGVARGDPRAALGLPARLLRAGLRALLHGPLHRRRRPSPPTRRCPTCCCSPSRTGSATSSPSATASWWRRSSRASTASCSSPRPARRGEGPLRVVAMVRPRTARRQPLGTIAVLEALLERSTPARCR